MERNFIIVECSKWVGYREHGGPETPLPLDFEAVATRGRLTIKVIEDSDFALPGVSASRSEFFKYRLEKHSRNLYLMSMETDYFYMSLENKVLNLTCFNFREVNWRQIRLICKRPTFSRKRKLMLYSENFDHLKGELIGRWLADKRANAGMDRPTAASKLNIEQTLLRTIEEGSLDKLVSLFERMMSVYEISEFEVLALQRELH